MKWLWAYSSLYTFLSYKFMGRHRQRQILRNLSAHINLKENEKCQESQFGAKKRKIRFSLFWLPDCPLRGIPVISSFNWAGAIQWPPSSFLFILFLFLARDSFVFYVFGPRKKRNKRNGKGTYSVRLEAQSRSDHNFIVTAPHLTVFFLYIDWPSPKTTSLTVIWGPIICKEKEETCERRKSFRVPRAVS